MLAERWPPSQANTKTSRACKGASAALAFAVVKVTVNGQERALEEGTTVATLLAELAVAENRLAVELNSRVLERGDWPTTLLASDDRVEIVEFVGGG